MNTLQEIINLANNSLVKTRNKYRYQDSNIIQLCCNNLNKLSFVALLIDLLGYSLVDAKYIADKMKDNNLTFDTACAKLDVIKLNQL